MTYKEAKEIFLNRGFVNGLFDGDKWRQSIVVISKWLEQEPCDCISKEFIEIVVEYPPADLYTYPEYKGMPYYSIKYRENGKEYVGFGTYKIEFLSQWIKEYFISDGQPKPKTGHWIEDDMTYCGVELVNYKCDKCGEMGGAWRKGLKPDKLPKYCMNCGAKMLPTDSEKE